MSNGKMSRNEIVCTGIKQYRRINATNMNQAKSRLIQLEGNKPGI